MDQKLIEEVINRSIKKLNDEYELINTTFLNVLHANIDQLIENTEAWFGPAAPKEFKDVLNSLMTLAYLYYEERREYSKYIVEEKYENVDLAELMDDIIEKVRFLFPARAVTLVAAESDCSIRASRSLVRESFFNILLSLFQFMDERSSCGIRLFTEGQNVKIALAFDNLAEELPNITKISRVFFSYFDGQEYRIRIGINIAVENLRNAGAVVKIENPSGRNSLLVTVSFASVIFLQTIEDIRAADGSVDGTDPAVAGLPVFLGVDDVVLDMVLREALQDTGFLVRRIDLFGVTGGDDGAPRAGVVDRQSIAKAFRDFSEFADAFRACDAVVVIYGSEEEPEDITAWPHLRALRKPFDVDAVIKLLRA
ncbi:MAG TPA: hypothetical protein PKM65_12760 [Spirochaetota bacterium]|nr:hypothetical protein [Spirochaetota bacterium]HNT10934.1 hypothetical protein [Spirochaetota bacterium]HOS41463.1 hypothetical protein [Spirochaetota bacterium]HPU90526.1 hypothetical protein [Spirochaetota bacterium]